MVALIAFRYTLRFCQCELFCLNDRWRYSQVVKCILCHSVSFSLSDANIGEITTYFDSVTLELEEDVII